MGYVKNQMIKQHELEFFIESAKAGTLDEYYPDKEGKRTKREMLIDTRGNTETTDGTIYMFEGVQVFVPDEVFMLTQPVVERIGTDYGLRNDFHQQQNYELAMDEYYHTDAYSYA